MLSLSVINFIRKIGFKTKMGSLVYINEDRVRELLDWDKTFEVIERSMASVSESRAFQKARLITQLGNTDNLLYTMPGYLSDPKIGALGCKLVTSFPLNKTQPTIMANILFFDDQSGELKAVIAGTEITAWRTAAASAVATKYLHKENNNSLAIIGAGTQGTIHAVAFQHFFNFSEVRIWNHKFERAEEVVETLKNRKCKGRFVALGNIEECVNDADVIVTATSSNKALIKYEWLKNGVHINAVGTNSYELDERTYKSANVFIDYWDGAKNELGALSNMGIEFRGQIGDLITGVIEKPESDAITVFQSLGMAVEDCAMARLIYDQHTEKPI